MSKLHKEKKLENIRKNYRKGKKISLIFFMSKMKISNTFLRFGDISIEKFKFYSSGYLIDIN